MRSFLGLLAALAAATFVALSAGSALANHVQCGDLIRQDTTLDSNLNCQGRGLYVLGNVTLDLGGHTITGPGQYSSPIYLYEGVVTSGGFTTTIENGTIRDFDEGVSSDASHGIFRNLRIIDNHDGLDGSGWLEISNNSFSGNAGSIGANTGIGFGFTAPIVIENNTVTHTIGNPGISVNGFAQGTYGHDDPISIRGNTVTDTQGDSGIDALGSGQISIERNVVTQTHSGGPGIEIRSSFPYPDTGQFLVTNNQVDHNVKDGINSAVSAINLTGNHTWFNGNLGIEAMPGTLGGGNWAKHNGNPLQCVPGTLCSTTGKPKS